VAFEYNETLGCYSCTEVRKPGEDSNYGRFIKATAERLAETGFFRRVYMAQEPLTDSPDTEFPFAAVYPDTKPETEHTNYANMKKYGILVLLTTVDDNPFRGVMRILAINEAAEEACRTKAQVKLHDGDFHENTLLESTPYVMVDSLSGTFMFATGFRVIYDATEPRKEE